MRNKVLVVDGNKREIKELEEMLQEVIDSGGEIFFAETREEGLHLMRKEAPHLLFLDAEMVGPKEDEWVHEGVHIVLMRHQHEREQKSEDFILKPLKERQVHEKCRSLLPHELAPPLPPM